MADLSELREVLLTLADQIDRDHLRADEVLSRLHDIFEMLGMLIALQVVHIDDAIFDCLRAIEHRVHMDYVLEELSLGAGRPRLEIPKAALRTFVLFGISIKNLASMFAVSHSTIRRRMREEGLSYFELSDSEQRKLLELFRSLWITAPAFLYILSFIHRKSDRYSSTGDEDLDAIVLDIQHCHPNAGCKMMMGHLRSRGIHIQRSRLADSIRRVNPEGVMMRRLSIQTARRRQYNVPAPNHLWHIDGNHKLIRWRIVVHGGIDGFSRLIVYINAATNNKATTVFDGFLAAVRQYGIPSRVSIERLWRDVYENVLDLFYTTFTELEIQGLLNPGADIDLFALHRCFLHHIQHHLQSFKAAWNQHGLRTANNQSPLELWLLHRKEGHDYSQVEEDYGVDWTGPHNHHPTEIAIPEMQLPCGLNEQELAALPNTNVPLSQALQVYFETVHTLKLMFASTL